MRIFPALLFPVSAAWRYPSEQRAGSTGMHLPLEPKAGSDGRPRPRRTTAMLAEFVAKLAIASYLAHYAAMHNRPFNPAQAHHS